MGRRSFSPFILAGSVVWLVMSAAGPGDPARAASSTQSRGGPGARACLLCHGAPSIREEVPGSRGAALFVPPDALQGTAHTSLSCVSCHPPLSANLHDDPGAELGAARASCDGCHRAEGLRYAEGAHGSAGGAPEAPRVRPTCLTCHGSHDVAPAGSRPFVVSMAARCSGCHTEQGQSFFGGNFHGKETRLGRSDVAVCADCHGAHRVLPASDPRSSVNPANVLATCRGCHLSAPPNFGDIQIHVVGDPLPSDPRLRLVTLYMVLLLVGTFGLFGIHTLMAIRREWRERHRGPAAT